MKLTIDQAGWPIHITDFDPRCVTLKEIEILRTLPYTNVLVVMHDLPTLTSLEYREFCHKVFKKIQTDNPSHDKRFLPDHDREIIRVTGRKDVNGDITGLFGMPEFLPWHCNQPGLPLNLRPDCLTLYSVEHTKGSVTAFSNSILALNDLRMAEDAPMGLLENLDKLSVYYEYGADLGGNTDNHDYSGFSGKNALVVQNKSGADGILFSNPVTDSFYIGDYKLPMDVYKQWHGYLSKFLIKKKYIYAHAWQDNEMIMNCQLLGQHARLPFSNMEKRLLWRIMGCVDQFDGSAIDTSQLA